MTALLALPLERNTFTQTSLPGLQRIGLAYAPVRQDVDTAFAVAATSKSRTKEFFKQKK